MKRRKRNTRLGMNEPPLIIMVDRDALDGLDDGRVYTSEGVRTVAEIRAEQPVEDKDKDET